MTETSHGFTAKSFEFLEGLAANNDKEWFHAHKDDFVEYCETPFIALLEALSNRLSDADYPLEGGKKTMFRMNRDVRFTEDKRPYKTSVSGLLTPSGSKSEDRGLLYIHFDAEGGFTATGFHTMSPKRLAPIRQAMIDRADEWDAVKESLDAAGRSLERDDSLTAMPKGFTDHDDHRHAEDIKLKSLIVREDLPKVAWTSGDVIDRIESLARDAQKLLTFEAPATG